MDPDIEKGGEVVSAVRIKGQNAVVLEVNLLESSIAEVDVRLSMWAAAPTFKCI